MQRTNMNRLDWYRIAILQSQLEKEAGWKENVAIGLISYIGGVSSYFEVGKIRDYMNQRRVPQEQQQQVVDTVNSLTRQNKSLDELDKEDFVRANEVVEQLKSKQPSMGTGNPSISDLMETIKRHEGVKHSIYLDPSKKNYCIGAGFNLNRSNSKQLIESVGGNYDLIMRGKQKINNKQVDQLLKMDIERSISDAKKFIPNYNNLHTDAKFVLVNMAYNMGINKLMGFKNLKTALLNYDYELASREMVNSRWMNQVGNRGVELVNIMKSIS